MSTQDAHTHMHGLKPAIDPGAKTPRGRNVDRRTPEWVTGLLFVSPWIVGFLSFMAAPILMSLYYSFTDYPLLEPPAWVGLGNYAEMFTDPLFWKTMGNTTLYAALAVPFGTILALFVAWLLNQSVKGLVFFRSAVFLPSLVPLVASSMIWLWLFNGELGLINVAIDGVLGPLGVRGPNWLGDSTWIMPALVLMSFWSIGQAVVIYIASLQDVPKSLYEAADLDGMPPLTKFLNVTLPMISPVVLFNVIMAIITSWQVFAVPYIMLGSEGGPDRAGFFYTMYLYDNAFRFQRMGYASAMAWVQLLIILSLTGLTFLASKKLVHYRA